jgi:tetratricopeptide (TPR) repeat protein
MIVVAIQNVDRTRDFSPSHVDKFPTSGGAEKFTQFISDELIPFVNNRFRTESYRILMGHSFGGSFAAYMLLTGPQVFNAYLSISPYLMYDDSYTIKLTKKKLRKEYNPPVQFYMTIGNEPDYFAALDEFVKIVENKSPKGLELTYVKMEKENHGSNPHLSIYNGLEFIFSDWKIPKDAFSKGLAAIDKHYQKLSNEYGFQVQTPELVINALGYNYLLIEKDIDKAIKTFSENVTRFPTSANVYDSLGEALENDSQFENAESNYKKAVDLARKINHPNLSIYEENLKRAKEKRNGNTL